MLDPLHFGGGNTVYQAFALGVPVVTWPGAFARGRVTYALYKRMGMMDLVVDSPVSYVEVAVRLARDKVFRDRTSKAIQERSKVIYEDIEAVRELERCAAAGMILLPKRFSYVLSQWP